MKKHFALTCIAYFFLGFALCFREMAYKYGIGLWPAIIVFTVSVIFFVVIAFTSMEKVKEKLYKEDEIKFDFENEKTKT